jgi:hypothetical protein
MVGWELLRTIDVFGSSVMYGVAYIVDRLYFVINPVQSSELLHSPRQSRLPSAVLISPHLIV